MTIEYRAVTSANKVGRIGGFDPPHRPYDQTRSHRQYEGRAEGGRHGVTQLASGTQGIVERCNINIGGSDDWNMAVEYCQETTSTTVVYHITHFENRKKGPPYQIIRRRRLLLL